MARIVQKFGGTSVADIEHIKNAAQLAKMEYDVGHQVVVVVSAMAGVTNQLVDYVNQIDNTFDPKEYDSIVSTGEQSNAGLMALAIKSLGIKSRSWLGWQIPIQTDAVHEKARITNIATEFFSLLAHSFLSLHFAALVSDSVGVIMV